MTLGTTWLPASDTGLKLLHAMTPTKSALSFRQYMDRLPQPDAVGTRWWKTRHSEQAGDDAGPAMQTPIVWSAASHPSGRHSGVPFRGAVREGSGVSVSQPVSQRPET